MKYAYVPQNPEEQRIVDRLTDREKLVFDCRPATAEDIPQLLAITAEASAYMRDCGVPQWQDDFPNADVFAADIAAGGCWLFTHDGERAGCMSLYTTPDWDYPAIRGAWLTEGDHYATIHRVAVGAAYRGRGLADEMMALGEDLAMGRGFGSVRVDTHEKNLSMRRLLERRGYVCCGTVTLTDTIEKDPLRVCYEKVF